jgi:putative membrane protein insertion efficiency factor
MTGVRAAARRASSLVRAVVAALVLAPIWVYRNVVSPMTPRTCRYYPSCSAYAEQAVKTHGAVRGSWLAVRRLARCHPWTAGGVDHVPPARDQHTNPASPVTGA